MDEKLEDMSPEIIQIANKYMKGCSILLVIREIQIKTTVKNHYIHT